MRELAKSMVGFSWAVGLFGFQQLNKAIGSVQEPPEVTAAQLDDVAHAAQRHLSDEFAQQFRAGDMWQRRVIDVMFDAASLRSVDPRNMPTVSSLAATLDPRPMLNDVDPRRVFQGGIQIMQRSIEMVRPAAPANNSPAAG